MSRKHREQGAALKARFDSEFGRDQATVTIWSQDAVW
jgi:hypothetical protein